MPHTVMMLIAGIVLLILLRLAIRDGARAARLFLILWFLVSIGNLLVGVLHAGYGWAEEAVIWLLVFGAPAAAALLMRRFWH
jgi:hypothetical membrane protein